MSHDLDYLTYCDVAVLPMALTYDLNLVLNGDNGDDICKVVLVSLLNLQNIRGKGKSLENHLRWLQPEMHITDTLELTKCCRDCRGNKF